MSASPSSHTRPAGRFVQILRDRPLVSFFVLSYAVTWLLWSPGILLGLSPFNEATHAPSLWILPGIAIGVTGTAFFMTAVTQGRAGVRRLVQRLTLWRVGPQWWAVAVLLLPVASIVAAVALGTPDALTALTPAALAFYPAAYLAHFVFGPLFEEAGWRGFALPRMQHRFGPARGTLLLGLLWSAWHFFLFAPGWFAGGLIEGLFPLVFFTVFSTTMTFVFTWLSNNTGASLLLAILLHGSVDGTLTYLQVLGEKGVISADAMANSTGLGLAIVCVLSALVLLAATRGRLSYPRYQHAAEQLDLDPAAVAVSRKAAR